MEHKPELQKQYFQFAYQTGSDIWSHVPYQYVAKRILPDLAKDSLVLDIGAGRGLWAMDLVDMGFKVLGMDYVESIVEKVNIKIHDHGYQDRARFIVGDALEIPFTENGFDIITDIGTLQHIPSNQWNDYVGEIVRVIKPKGYYLKVSLSRKTQNFLGLHPISSDDGNFNKFGVHYHFFSTQEITDIFSQEFTIVDQQFEQYNSQSDPNEDIVLVLTLMQKK